MKIIFPGIKKPCKKRRFSACQFFFCIFPQTLLFLNWASVDSAVQKRVSFQRQPKSEHRLASVLKLIRKTCNIKIELAHGGKKRLSWHAPVLRLRLDREVVRPTKTSRTPAQHWPAWRLRFLAEAPIRSQLSSKYLPSTSPFCLT